MQKIHVRLNSFNQSHTSIEYPTLIGQKSDTF